jgi:hypothetical protein
VHEDRADRRVRAGQQALRLAEAVAEQQAGPAGRGVAAPPVVDLGLDHALRPPAVMKQSQRTGSKGSQLRFSSPAPLTK